MANWDEISTEGNVEDRRGTAPTAAFAGAGGIVALLLTLGLDYLGLNVSTQTVQDTLGAVQSLNTSKATQTSQPAEFQARPHNQAVEQPQRKLVLIFAPQTKRFILMRPFSTN